MWTRTVVGNECLATSQSEKENGTKKGKDQAEQSGEEKAVMRKSTGKEELTGKSK